MTVNYTNITELTNLSAFTKYVIYVSALSSGGVGPGNTTNTRTDDAGTDGLCCQSYNRDNLNTLKTFVVI